MKTIKNFVESSHSSNEIVVMAIGKRKDIVAIICWAGSCSFQHSMTPNQARALAGYLQAEANFCEQQAKQVEEVTA
jgi:hypothetical protein